MAAEDNETLRLNLEKIERQSLTRMESFMRNSVVHFQSKTRTNNDNHISKSALEKYGHFGETIEPDMDIHQFRKTLEFKKM